MQRINLTTRYAKVLMHISMIVIAFVIGHDAMVAMDMNESHTGSSHHTVAVEQCVLAEGAAQQGSVHPTFSWEMIPSSHIADECADDQAFTRIASIAPPRCSTALRIAMQVFLN